MKKPHQLVGAKVVASEVKPETIAKTVTKMMKVIAITREPKGRTALIHLALPSGILAFEIDEPTAKAIAKVFD